MWCSATAPLCSCCNVTRDGTATLGVATGSNKTEASQRSNCNYSSRSQSSVHHVDAAELQLSWQLSTVYLSLLYVVPESHMVCDCELTRLECRCATDDGTDDTDNVPLAAHIFISSTTTTATAACNNNSQLAAASACISGHIHIPLPCTFPCSCEFKQIVQILLLHLKTN